MESVKQTVSVGKNMTDAASVESDATTTNAAKTPKGFGVAASPFNGVKLELGICIILGMLLWLGAESIIADEGTQLLMLLAYSLSSAIWLVLRTRAVLRRYEMEQSSTTPKK